jgi:serine/threonine-protein phosphatase 6 regulatory ankyrin repeat subunit B
MISSPQSTIMVLSLSWLPAEIVIQVCERVVERASESPAIEPKVLDGIAFADSRSYIRSRKIFRQTHFTWLRETQNAAALEDILHSIKHPERTNTLAKLALNIRDKHGREPMSYAAQKGHITVVKLLLHHIPSRPSRDKPPCTRSSTARPKTNTIVQHLSQHVSRKYRPRVAALDNLHRSALSYAAENGHTKVVDLLLNWGANPRKPEEQADRTALSYAVEKGHTDIARLLLQKRASVKTFDAFGMQPLHYAAREGHLEILRMLQKAGARCQSDTKHSKETPLHLAAKNGHEQTVQLLLQNGANCNSTDDFKRTPLHGAANKGHEGTVLLLLRHGAKHNIEDDIQRTPIHEAAEKGHYKTVQMLLQNGASCNGEDGWRRTPLSLAAKGGHMTTVQLLLANGAITKSQLW